MTFVILCTSVWQMMLWFRVPTMSLHNGRGLLCSTTKDDAKLAIRANGLCGNRISKPFLMSRYLTLMQKTVQTQLKNLQIPCNSLHLRMGGLNVALPQDLHKNLEKSIELSTPLASFNNDSLEIQQCELEQTKISLRQKADMQRELISKRSRIENSLPEMKYTIQLASEKGASSWLNALPLSKHGFDLTKTEFRDGIALRYTWEAKNTPAICPCGKDFSLTHALHCAKGGYTHLRHNQIWDVFANLIDVVCHDVQIVPKLQSLDGEIFSSNSTTTDDDARLDIKANGGWGSRFNCIFFDVKIFNPHAKSCLSHKRCIQILREHQAK